MLVKRQISDLEPDGSAPISSGLSKLPLPSQQLMRKSQTQGLGAARGLKHSSASLGQKTQQETQQRPVQEI